MANNTNINKVIYGGRTLIDLTGDTVTEEKLLSGVTAHDKSGASITGSCTYDIDSSEDVERDGEMVDAFCTALMEGKPDEVERLFTGYMAKTISVRDTSSRKGTKENFYHGLLLGILSYKGGWFVISNRESGNGFSDILIQIDGAELGIVIEVKYAQDGREEQECQKALKQIVDKEYEASLRRDGVHKILKYGIACNRKKCRVMMEVQEVYSDETNPV